ncbi:PIR Superfamily Protein [Plasmodium ovale wallikeri]|uniref:PIR protein n=2 Tax=Plasmodium ovale TaxID=36330 RepID=A0A1C3KGK4_PLAOA|nr:PIR Superfamily Protein [Plasmodium ovale wallikeri]SBT72791.1 PIR protein [Plasmodium ovale]
MSSHCGCEKKHDTPQNYALNFHIIPLNFEITNEALVNHIIKIDDPYLQHISLHLVHRYQEGNSNFSKCTIPDNKRTACRYLNYWSNYIKDLYTYAGKCSKKENLWKSHIDTLWKLLENTYTVQTGKSNEAWCKEYNYDTYNKTPIPTNLSIKYDEIVQKYCNPTIPQPSLPVCEGYIDGSASHRIAPIDDSPQSNCLCSTESSMTFAQQAQGVSEECIQNSSDSTTFYIALSSGFTLLGTIFILFFLYKFTPLISWLNRKRINKKELGSYINEVEEEELLGDYENMEVHNQNIRNKIFYNSLRL